MESYEASLLRRWGKRVSCCAVISRPRIRELIKGINREKIDADVAQKVDINFDIIIQRHAPYVRLYCSNVPRSDSSVFVRCLLQEMC